MRFLCSVLVCALLQSCSPEAQHIREGDLRIGFYNVENLFDTIDQVGIRDDGFSPEGRQQWTSSRYNTKLKRIGKVIEAMSVPEVFGLAEIENRSVLEDLIEHTILNNSSYGIVHRNSPDERGIDVALLYSEDDLALLDTDYIPIRLHPSIADDPNTRDILKARFKVGTDTVLIYVNHWPSRSGGLAKTEKRRIFAARQLHEDIQRELEEDPNANLIAIGDFNDEPMNKSVSRILRAGQRNEVIQYRAMLYNTSIIKDLKGIGSYNYKGSWDMLDQIMVSRELIDGIGCSKFLTFNVFKAPWMLYHDTHYGERPNRTYGGSKYYGGFSDHLPVYADFEFCIDSTH